MRIPFLDDDRFHLRRVQRSRDDVISQAIVDDASAVPHEFFEQAVANCLQRSAFDLTRCENRMNRAADVLSRGDLRASHFERVHIDFDFGDFSPPRVTRISIARISFVVPLNARW